MHIILYRNVRCHIATLSHFTACWGNGVILTSKVVVVDPDRGIETHRREFGFAVADDGVGNNLVSIFEYPLQCSMLAYILCHSITT